MSVHNWDNARLEDLTIKVGSGSTPRGGEANYKKVGVPLIRSMNVVFFGFKRDGLAHLDDDQAAALDNVTVRGGDVLLNITGASIGRVTMAPMDLDGARVNQHVCIIRPSPAIDARYLRAFLSGPLMQQFIFGENYGVTRQALTKQQILDFKIPIAPLPEQKRIADKLEAVLGRVDTCRARLDRLPALLKRFRQSVLSAATSGRLTEEWRMTNGVNDEWRTRALEDLTLKITDGEHITPKRASSGKYLLSARNIQNGSIALSNVDYVPTAEFERIRKRCDPSIGDVLLSCSGSVGRAALVDRDDYYVMVRSAAMIRPNREILNPTFLMFGMQSPYLQEQILEKSSATAQSNIFLGSIKGLKIPLPTLPEQQEIVRRVEDLFAFADRIEARLATAQKTVERLTPATLAKAFRGELVPQDPNDEPASMLLERLRASATVTPSPKTRRKSVKFS